MQLKLEYACSDLHVVLFLLNALYNHLQTKMKFMYLTTWQVNIYEIVVLQYKMIMSNQLKLNYNQ